MSRPKRKATINKSYNDTTDYSALEDKLKKSKPNQSEKTKKNNSISNGTKNGGTKDEPTSSTFTPTSVSDRNSPGTVSDVNTGAIPLNWQPLPKPIDYFSSKLNLKNAYIDQKNKCLVCPHQSSIPMDYDAPIKKLKKFTLTKGQFIYMISEPAGEPYYIGKIMGFKNTKSENQNDEIVTENLKQFEFQIQWFYRPRDISKSSSDSRLLFASMHSDTCPLSSFRGIVNVQHKQDIEDLEEFVKKPNTFYFDKLYDRYMMKFYDVLSTEYLLKVGKNEKSKNFLIALNKRFEYIFIEPTMTKFLINGFQSDSCTCETCGQWCSTQDSVNCADCSRFYHMYCLDPPLLKKPSRGFSWHCESCTKNHLKQYKSNRLLMLGNDNKLSNELELINDIEEIENNFSSPPESSIEADILPKYELMAIDFLKSDHLSFDQRRLQEEWCMRYLGIHSKLEDAVDLDDRSPYPRASTRIGAKHQATYIPEYIDHPLVYYDPKPSSTTLKKPKLKIKPELQTKPLPLPTEFEGLDVKEYPQWLQPRPKGYIERGVDDGEEDDPERTCTLLWKPLAEDINDGFAKLEKYIRQCSPIAEAIEMTPNSPNFVDKILNNYFKFKGDTEKAMDESLKITKQLLNEPILTKEEIRLFEQGVKEFGSELYPVYKMVKTVPLASIVRFYYLWKKTKNGRLIWGNFEGRIKKKLQNIQNSKKDSQVELFNEDDDSSYDSNRIADKHFTCKYCDTDSSPQWFRLTGQDNTTLEFVGLCFRCARLWRRYGVIWQDPVEVDKRIHKTGKKKIEHELLRDYEAFIAESSTSAATSISASNISSSSDTKSKKRTSPPPQPSSSKKKKVEAVKPVVKKLKEDKPKVKAEKKKPVKQETNSTLSKSPQSSITPTPPPPPPSKPFETDHLISPLINIHDLEQPEDAEQPKQIDELIKSYKIKKLCDLKYLLNDDPFENEVKQPANCSICDTQNYTESNHLICQNCGITVHLSCVGISTPAQRKTDWMCECCLNDLHPRFETEYRCILCDKTGGFLKPVHDTDNWVHLTCCIINYRFIATRNNITSITKNSKEYLEIINTTTDEKVRSKLLIELLTNNVDIKNVDKVFLNNRKLKCSICNLGGSISKCKLCSKYCHVTCNAKLKFKFSTNEIKLRVNNTGGKIEPVIICSTHTSDEYLDINTPAKRNQSSKEAVPLIQLFLEDLIKSNTSRITGNHLKAVNYLNLIQDLLNKETLPSSSLKHCDKCQTEVSPYWREIESQTVCQACFHKSKAEPNSTSITAQEFLHVINEPISGEQFGIKDYNDHITNIYAPLNVNEVAK